MKIYGRNPVHEVLKSDRRPVHALYLARGIRGGKLADIRAIAEMRKIEIHWEDKRKLDFLAGNPNHQGVVAIVGEGRLKLSLSELVFKGQMGDKLGLVVLLDGVQDPRNLGAVVRTAAAVEADGVVIPKNRAADLSEGAAKAAAGGAEHVDVVQATNVADTLEMFKSAGYWIYGADAEAEKDYTEMDYQRNLVLVFGGEQKGIRPLVRKKCDELTKIPISPNIESLNVSVAAAVVLFEARKQREAALKEED